MSDVVLREYVRRISDAEITFLRTRFRQRLCGDMAEIAVALARDSELDAWLQESTTADEWYSMVDKLASFVDREFDRRHSEAAKIR
jgi:hypothetical protein